MKQGIYSAFWLSGGILTLPGWFTKGYAFASKPEPVAEPMPTPAELEAFAQKPLILRQHIEQQGYGFVVSVGDSGDRKQARQQQKRAA